ncbi:MAG: phosphate ABC transporter permease PstA [Chloroflexi bacterium]|nr:phosphate ABC transporter permease PstA [Chloroflexota bacterium]
MLFFSIIRQAFTYVTIYDQVNPATLSDKPLENLSQQELGDVIENHYGAIRTGRNDIRTLVFNNVLGLSLSDQEKIADRERAKETVTVREVFEDKDKKYPAELADQSVIRLDVVGYAALIEQNFDQEQLYDFVIKNVVQPLIVNSWTLDEYFFSRDKVNQDIADTEARLREDKKDPTIELTEPKFHSWVQWHLITKTIDLSRPEDAGLRTAIIGSLWMITLTILIALPLGVGAAIYLEEYSSGGWLARIIQTNIDNLAGVPSIIYGILGLALFVRALEKITSGDIFGLGVGGNTATGRTILSASLTMGLLILPVIIINAQEAIRAVPDSLRQASYGLGATKWQTVWNHVLPNAMPGILTGTILAISRAFGETAVLVVVGSITRITVDPSGPFSRFTVLPLQIFALITQPQAQFRNVAAAGILLLLTILLSLNAVAVILRSRFSKRAV